MSKSMLPHVLVVALTLAVVGICVQPLHAQTDRVSLKFATVAWLVAGAQDMASTVAAPGTSAAGCLHERNPLISPFANHPVAMVAVGAAEEMAAVGLARKLLANRHPKVMRGLLFGLAGAHAGFAISNWQQGGQWCGAEAGR